jgi:hypothetical protein
VKARSLLLVAGLLAATTACAPSPERIALSSRASPLEATTTLVEGDLLVVDARPREDDGKEMKLCVDATSSSPSVRVQRVHDDCDLFVVSAAAPGRATVRFEARGTWSEVHVDVPLSP